MSKAGAVLGGGKAGFDSVLAVIGLYIGVPALVAMGSGYLVGKHGAKANPGYTAVSLKKEQLRNLRDTLEFQKRLREYKEDSPMEKFKEIRL